jgi:hypothetical protein
MLISHLNSFVWHIIFKLYICNFNSTYTILFVILLLYKSEIFIFYCSDSRYRIRGFMFSQSKVLYIKFCEKFYGTKKASVL